MELPLNPRMVLPAGTQVVARRENPGPAGEGARPAGAVGMVVRSPVDNSRPYRMRFPDGGEADLRREEFDVRRQSPYQHQ